MSDAIDITLAPELAAQIAHVLEHLNEQHADSVALLARLAGARESMVDAELASADRSGLRLAVRHDDGSVRDFGLPFTERPDSLAGVRAELLALLRAARARVGTSVPQTSMERELLESSRLPTFVTSVERAESITSSLRRIVLRGGLDGFRMLGPDSFVFVMVPRQGAGTSPIRPGFRMQDFEALPEGLRPAGAYYTVRRFEPETQRLELWCVLHDHAQGVSAWARHATPGDATALCGPRSSFSPPAGTTSFLLIGDETALPAIASIVESLQPSQQAQIVLETGDGAHTSEVPLRPGVAIDWCGRGREAPGTGTRLLDAVRGLTLPRTGLYVFGAAEAGQVLALRRHLRRERGFPSGQLRLTAYWRRSG
jgi:NADPH-dependent ferric siderophore reductase